MRSCASGSSRRRSSVPGSATTRASAILHAVWILLFVALFPNVLALVPSEYLTENEVAAAAVADQGEGFNPQQQFRVTWPAEPVEGFLVSDRVAYQLFEIDDTALPSVGKVHPPALWNDIAGLVVKPEEIGAEELRSFVDPSAGANFGSQDARLMEQLQALHARSGPIRGIGRECWNALLLVHLTSLPL